MSWGYTKDDGPHTWASRYPLAAGDGQSPINIVEDDAIFDSELSSHPIKISYLPEADFEIENTGESFKVKIKQKSEISGGPLTDRYRLEQFHLHWGSADDHGSEHTVNGRTYAAELHLVHWNCGKYASFSEAVDKNDGLAVLGIMIQPGEDHRCFKMLTDSMDLVKCNNSHCSLSTTFDPSCLFPDDTSSYWTYHGSLTTPPCCESVQWIVFEQPIQFSHRQLERLRGLQHHGEGDYIMDNYRPPLPLGNRKVRTSRPLNK